MTRSITAVKTIRYRHESLSKLYVEATTEGSGPIIYIYDEYRSDPAPTRMTLENARAFVALLTAAING